MREDSLYSSSELEVELSGSGARVDQTTGEALGDRLAPGPRMQFLIDPSDPVPNPVDGKEDLSRDDGIGLSFGETSQHIDLSLRERILSVRGCAHSWMERCNDLARDGG